MRVKPGRNGAYLSRCVSAWASGPPVDWLACFVAFLSLPTGRGVSGRRRASSCTQWEARGSHV